MFFFLMRGKHIWAWQSLSHLFRLKRDNIFKTGILKPTAYLSSPQHLLSATEIVLRLMRNVNELIDEIATFNDPPSPLLQFPKRARLYLLWFTETVNKISRLDHWRKRRLKCVNLHNSSRASLLIKLLPPNNESDQCHFPFVWFKQNSQDHAPKWSCCTVLVRWNPS